MFPLVSVQSYNTPKWDTNVTVVCAPSVINDKCDGKFANTVIELINNKKREKPQGAQSRTNHEIKSSLPDYVTRTKLRLSHALHTHLDDFCH